MALILYNTLSHELEPFTPLDSSMVRFYTCGPTVYDYAHIGNFRSFLAADVLRRYLEWSGWPVRHVMNMTDVGHMVDDEAVDGGGPDKLEVARRRLKESKKVGTMAADVEVDPDDPTAIAEFYARCFLKDARMLGLKVAQEQEHDPSLMPRPTQFIEQMIDLIRRLLASSHAYVASDGVVYFDIQSFPAYGRLSGNTLDQLRAGAGGRVDASNQSRKKHPADFMLWNPDGTHLMRWPSPWGEGYPGWHLECSAMAQALLGEGHGNTIDLHSGGEDNLFPHHECEIAQSCSAFGTPFFARYWFHPRHLFVEGAKMSKSRGNFYTLRDLTARGYGPGAIRLELIKTHYRTNANFTFQGLKDSERQIQRWRAFMERGRHGSPSAPARMEVRQAFRTAMDNDLNISGAIGIINTWIGQTPEPTQADAALMLQFDSVLSVLALVPTDQSAAIRGAGIDPTDIERRIEERAGARLARDFARSDRIRDELLSLGVELKDGPQGTTWHLIRR